MTWTHPKRKSEDSALFVRAARFVTRLMDSASLTDEERESCAHFARKCATLGAYSRKGYEPKFTSKFSRSRAW